MPTTFPRQLVTGISTIDAQHRALIAWSMMIRSMGAADRRTILRAAQFLIAYVRFHFDSEEYAMVASGYEGLTKHRREHLKIRKELAAVSKSINSNRNNSSAAVTSLQRLVQDWFQLHISGTDLGFARYCAQEPSTRSIRLPSPQEMTNSGLKITDLDQVEAVHFAGELSAEELKSRLA